MRNLPAKTVKKRWELKRKRREVVFFQVPPFSFSAPGRHEPLRNRHKKGASRYRPYGTGKVTRPAVMFSRPMQAGKLKVYTPSLALALGAAGFDLLEEIVALVIHQDKGGEVNDFNLPNGLHAQFGELYALNALDALLRKDGSRATDRAEVETAVLLAGVGNDLRTVALGYHDE